MELDEASPDSNFSSVFAVNQDVCSIETGVQSMTLVNEDDMFEFSNGCGASENPCHSAMCGNKILHSSTEAFLQLQSERDDTTFSRTCLFCKKHFKGNRSLLLEHFVEQHNFFIGQPDNIVFINELLDSLEKMLKKLQCLYCRKFFKDWLALKEHMRKKMHKRINPADSNFDRFYMTNYLNMYDNMDSAVSDAYCEMKDQCSDQYDHFFEQDNEKEIDVEPKDSSIICLYCDSKYCDFDEIMHHLKVVHGFDFKYLMKEYKLCFYSQIKLINYIRRKVLIKECIICDTQCSSKENLLKHMTESGHIKYLPEPAKWNQSEFYFSTLDTDYLLCGLQDDDGEDGGDSAIEIISEDMVMPKSSILTDENLRRTLL